MSAAASENKSAAVTFVPDLLYVNGRFERDTGLACHPDGRVIALVPLLPLRELLGGRLPEDEAVTVLLPGIGVIFPTRFRRLPNRALLPGMVNAHSHAFQRVIRGRTEHRASAARDSFWTWRAAMYAAASRLTPEALYDASRMAFMEMALSGITSVGEFHYLHRAPDGSEYDDPNLLARTVCAAARDVGLRVALLRVAYARSGFRLPPEDRQRRFIEPDADTYIRHTQTLINHLARDGAGRARRADDAQGDGRGVEDAAGVSWAAPLAWVGVAPHSVRAVPREYLRAACVFAEVEGLPVHMHVAEQPAEVAACLEETGLTPVAMLDEEGVLGARFTGVHAIHLTPEEVRALGGAGAHVCACPTTERNLGDGVVPADALLAAGVPLALGTDSHAQIDLLEDARELEYHLRLTRLERNVLAPAPRDAERTGGADASHAGGEAGAPSPETSALAARLFECATVNGARSIGLADGGELAARRPADFFTVALDDPSIAGAGAEDLLAAIVFSLSRAGVRDVAVGGRLVVEDGRHQAQGEIVSRFAALQRELWS